MQFDPTEIRGNMICAEAGDETKPGGMFISKHNEKTAYSFLFDQAWKISKEQLIKELQETDFNRDAQGPLSYYVLRDLSNKRYLTVCPDGIYKYNVLDFKEEPIADIRDALLTANNERAMKKTLLNTITPVLAYWDGGVRKAIALKMPPVRFRYNNTVLGINQMITLPPVVYKVEATGGVIEKTYVCVIMQDSTDPTKLKLAHLPMPNIYANTSICVGSSRSLTSTNKKDIISVAYASWDLFVNSNWNVDLLDGHMLPSNLDEVFNELKDVPEELTRPGWPLHRKLIAVLRDKEGWSKLQWRAVDDSIRETFGL